MGALNYPGQHGHLKELDTGIRRYCGSRHVHGETRLGQIAVVWSVVWRFEE